MDGAVGLGVLGEAHEAEATAAAGIAVLDNSLVALEGFWDEGHAKSYGFLDLAEFREFLTERAIVGVPSEATSYDERGEGGCDEVTYPMKSLDMAFQILQTESATAHERYLM